MTEPYIRKPYKIGSNRKSLGFVLPAPVVKSLEIDPLSDYLLLKVSGKDNLQLKVLRKEDLDKKEAGKEIPAPTGINL